MDEVTITVNIADRPYRLKIRRDEEGVIRKAVEDIGMQLKEYSEQFAFQDRQDLMAMALLHFAATAVRPADEPAVREKAILHRLSRLDEILTESLEKV